MIWSDGYLDIEVNSPIAPAEVAVYAVTKGKKARTVNEPQHCIYGIDPGTTYSVAGYIVETGRPAVTRNSDSQDTTPSVVYSETPGNIVVGKVAKESADVYPEQVVSLIKREMGEERHREFFGKGYTPPSISALILGVLAKGAETSTHRPVSEAVITVPAITRQPSHLLAAER